MIAYVRVTDTKTWRCLTMQTFGNVNFNDFFTLERKLKNTPHKPTLWRKKSNRTAWLAHNKSIWFYFSKNTKVYQVKNGG